MFLALPLAVSDGLSVHVVIVSLSVVGYPVEQGGAEEEPRSSGNT